MTDLEPLIEKHFQVLAASSPAPQFGRYLRPVMLGSAHLVLAAAVREAYDQGRLDAALALREQEGGRGGRRAFQLRPRAVDP